MARGLSKRNPGGGGGAGGGGVARTYVRGGCVLGRGYAPDTRRTRPHAHTLRRSGLRPRHTANPATRPTRFVRRAYPPDPRRPRPPAHTLRRSGLRPPHHEAQPPPVAAPRRPTGLPHHIAPVETARDQPEQQPR